jgi:hypothetical protein
MRVISDLPGDLAKRETKYGVATAPKSSQTVLLSGEITMFSPQPCPRNWPFVSPTDLFRRHGGWLLEVGFHFVVWSTTYWPFSFPRLAPKLIYGRIRPPPCRPASYTFTTTTFPWPLQLSSAGQLRVFPSEEGRNDRTAPQSTSTRWCLRSTQRLTRLFLQVSLLKR